VSVAITGGTHANHSRETRRMNRSDRCPMITVFPC